VPNHGEVVSDEKECCSAFALHGLEQIDDLTLGADV
jgi:hypothetical protein